MYDRGEKQETSGRNRPQSEPNSPTVNLCQKQAPHVQAATQQTDANRDKRERLNMGVSSRQEVLDIVYDAGAEGETTPAS
ncbi:hypothetical protein CE91St35_07450 [Eggerthella lenta]|nr:hypothetical protein CE91St34_26240 [Eggerthella lenta]GKG86591.1 hypothetical protein CE91St35_07450 [Eggerthella lenta]